MTGKKDSRKFVMPREKLETKGLEGLTDADLISILLGSGIEGVDVRKLAVKVFRLVSEHIKDNQKDGVVDWNDVAQIRGIGKVKAMQIVCALELGKRVFGQPKCLKTIISCKDDVVSVVGHLRTRKREHVVVLMLNARNELMGKKTVAIGSLNMTVVEPRDVFVDAVKVGASGIILVHNHPSGDTSPSEADNRFTERIKKAGELLGIELLDHVIV
ncbi:MAG: DNA repair protein RadC [Patescibacteria group bacterium]|nr:DNA repair protein RadC [Patescibacteria group bacterium]